MAQALSTRLERTLAEARAELGLPDAPLEVTIEALLGRLAAEDVGVPEAQSAHRAEIAGLRRRFDERLEGLARLDDAIGRLRDLTSPATVLESAPAELCRSSDFDRVLVSSVTDGGMQVEAVHFRDDPEAARAAFEALREAPIELERQMIEVEILRRRRAALVPHVDAQTGAGERLHDAMGWSSCVAAPVGVGARAIALIHADRGAAQRLGEEQRRLLWEFAAGLGQAFESAELQRTLRQERVQMREFLERLNARSADLSDAPIELKPRAASSGPVDEPTRAAGALDGLLTRREREVLELLCEGRSNRNIAGELVITERTVKFHVNSILRKLRVGNRAEAVSRYLGLGGFGRA